VLLRKSLHNLEAIRPTLQRLGARHVAYGALPEHYPVAVAILLESMAVIAGEAWTAEIEGAWSAALTLVTEAMLEGIEMVELAA
jgi:hemoglobin-like flavoprotein